MADHEERYTLDEEWDAFVSEVEAERDGAVDARGAELHAYADRLLARIGDAEAELDVIRETAALRRADIARWEEETGARYERRRAYLEAELRMLAESEAWAPEPGKKSRSLPHGDVGTRKAPASVEVNDEEAALAWCEKHNVEVKVKKSVLKTPLKAYAEEHGNALPPESGARYVRGSDRFYYRVEVNDG